MKGQEAKSKVIKIISDAFGDKFIGEVDKKLYVISEENGEKMQVCISLTIPKNPVAIPQVVPVGGKLNFEERIPQVQVVQPAEITEKEKQIAEDLLKRLGL